MSWIRAPTTVARLVKDQALDVDGGDSASAMRKTKHTMPPPLTRWLRRGGYFRVCETSRYMN
jgi:hypothetical protein